MNIEVNPLKTHAIDFLRNKMAYLKVQEILQIPYQILLEIEEKNYLLIISSIIFLFSELNILNIIFFIILLKEEKI